MRKSFVALLAVELVGVLVVVPALCLCGGCPQNGVPDSRIDTDADGLADTDETGLGTNPGVADTDGDGLPDGVEVAAGLDPLVLDQVATITAIYCEQVIAMQAEKDVVWSSIGPVYRPLFTGWRVGDKVAVHYTNTEYQWAYLLNASIGGKVFPANMIGARALGEVVLTGTITRIAPGSSWVPDSSWVDVGATRWNLISYDRSWSVGDFVVVTHGVLYPESGEPVDMWYIVNVDRCDQALLFVPQ